MKTKNIRINPNMIWFLLIGIGTVLTGLVFTVTVFADETTIDDAIQFIQSKIDQHTSIREPYAKMEYYKAKFIPLGQCAFRIRYEYTRTDEGIWYQWTWVVNVSNLDRERTEARGPFITIITKGGAEMDYEICEKGVGQNRWPLKCTKNDESLFDLYFDSADIGTRVVNALRFWIDKCQVKEKF